MPPPQPTPQLFKIYHDSLQNTHWNSYYHCGEICTCYWGKLSRPTNYLSFLPPDKCLGCVLPSDDLARVRGSTRGSRSSAEVRRWPKSERVLIWCEVTLLVLGEIGQVRTLLDQRHRHSLSDVEHQRERNYPPLEREIHDCGQWIENHQMTPPALGAGWLNINLTSSLYRLLFNIILFTRLLISHCIKPTHNPTACYIKIRNIFQN